MSWRKEKISRSLSYQRNPGMMLSLPYALDWLQMIILNQLFLKLDVKLFLILILYKSLGINFLRLKLTYSLT